MRRRRAGFTLVELLAVLAIVGILAALVYPSYARQMIKARRTEGQLALLDAMQRQEQYRALHHSYAAFSAVSGTGTGADTDTAPPGGFRWWVGNSPGTSAYELDARACAGQDIAQCVVVRARPGTDLVDRRFADPECGTLSLDSNGAQAASGPSTRCWP